MSESNAAVFSTFGAVLLHSLNLWLHPSTPHLLLLNVRTVSRWVLLSQPLSGRVTYDPTPVSQYPLL